MPLPSSKNSYRSKRMYLLQGNDGRSQIIEFVMCRGDEVDFMSRPNLSIFYISLVQSLSFCLYPHLPHTTFRTPNSPIFAALKSKEN
jgi:hypothetical protein